MKSYSEFIQGIHHVIGESKHLNSDQFTSVKPFTLDQERKIKKIAYKLHNKYPGVPQNTIIRMIKNDVSNGKLELEHDQNIDLESIEQELAAKDRGGD